MDWAPLVPYGPGPYGPLGPFGTAALLGTLVNQRLGSMANPLNLLATIMCHKAIYIYIYIYI